MTLPTLLWANIVSFHSSVSQARMIPRLGDLCI